MKLRFILLLKTRWQSVLTPWGIGAVPPIEGDKIFYDHITLLKENGVFLLETMNTGRLAREEVKEFMFVLGQARLKGAVQMIINPVALW